MKRSRHRDVMPRPAAKRQKERPRAERRRLAIAAFERWQRAVRAQLALD